NAVAADVAEVDILVLVDSGPFKKADQSRGRGLGFRRHQPGRQRDLRQIGLLLGRPTWRSACRQSRREQNQQRRDDKHDSHLSALRIGGKSFPSLDFQPTATHYLHLSAKGSCIWGKAIKADIEKLVR